ncbi:MAG: thiol:disulfide interchange protein DsbG [Halomonadaceae bacterium]|nr:MAG: thiol:disulfide interchange protein DsbG [Halomonadaceae bacterium]
MKNRTRYTAAITLSLSVVAGGFLILNHSQEVTAAGMSQEQSAQPTGFEPNQETFDAMWQAMEEAHWIQDGDSDAERVIYTFTDPNCPFCNRFWRSARPWVEAGKVQIRHIVVGIIRDDSGAKAAFLLEADDPQQALHAHSSDHSTAQARSETGEARKMVHENNSLFRDLGLAATPTTYYRHGKQLVTVPGAPFGARLEAVMGSPEP